MWGVGVVESVWWEYMDRECEGVGVWKCVCVYRSMSMKVCQEVCVKVDVRVWGV